MLLIMKLQSLRGNHTSQDMLFCSFLFNTVRLPKRILCVRPSGANQEVFLCLSCEVKVTEIRCQSAVLQMLNFREISSLFLYRHFSYKPKIIF